jgi:hypothetical protein
MSKIHVFTSAACNYVPKISMLVESIRRHHPDWRIHIALADERPDGSDLLRTGVDEVHALPELGIPHWRPWAFCHSIVELATAIKPFALQKLLARPGCSGVVYLDPDIVLFSPLSEVEARLGSASVALTPHLVDPDASVEAVIDNEIASALQHGIYNLGFIAVSASGEGMRFARWWADRTYRFCRADIPNGLFTDQRWVDLAPAFFEGVEVLRSRRLNVATWNLTTRRLEGTVPEGLRVNGEPLGFYHFTGFDSGAHGTMAWKNARDQPAVAELIRWYQRALARCDSDPLCAVPWAYGCFDDGTEIPRAARLVYRDRVDLQRAFTDPFDAGAGGFKAWWSTQARHEYPGIFDPDRRDEALRELTRQISRGFIGADSAPALATGMRERLRRAVGDPAYRGSAARRLWRAMLSGNVRELRRALGW